MYERLHAVVSGRVQMVMYRDFVQRKASGLALTGYVRNLPDGTVDVVAEGSREKLDALVTKLWKGSLLSEVANVTASFQTATGEFKEFVITYD